MAAANDPTAQRLAWWPSFYKAWHAASPEQRAAEYQVTLDYRAGLIDGRSELNGVQDALGFSFPVGVV